MAPACDARGGTGMAYAGVPPSRAGYGTSGPIGEVVTAPESAVGGDACDGDDGRNGGGGTGESAGLETALLDGEQKPTGTAVTGGGGDPYVGGVGPASTRALRGKNMEQAERMQSVIEKMADRIGVIHADLGDGKSAMNGFLERQDRDANMDRELTLLQQFPEEDSTRKRVLRDITARVRILKCSSSTAQIAGP